jgi:hypothetical protein
MTRTGRFAIPAKAGIFEMGQEIEDLVDSGERALSSCSALAYCGGRTKLS